MCTKYKCFPWIDNSDGEIKKKKRFYADFRQCHSEFVGYVYIHGYIFTQMEIDQ